MFLFDHSSADLFNEPPDPVFGDRYPTQRPEATHVDLLQVLKKAGDHMTLDDALEMLSTSTSTPYLTIAKLVRGRKVVVEFEATPRPFPNREILVRRL